MLPKTIETLVCTFSCWFILAIGRIIVIQLNNQKNSPITMSENPAIYTSNHIPSAIERIHLAALGVENGLGLCGKAKDVAV